MLWPIKLDSIGRSHSKLLSCLQCTEGVVLYRGRVYIPDNPQLHHDLVHVHHGATVAGHPRQWTFPMQKVGKLIPNKVPD